ncbi:MAG: hypothetical protein HOC71_02580 [Candidatus Latescibacteria bacterium]|jgi:molybdopterin/thiamine biosynthesis adenylyltransferase|nr:hypothetical protein [Candidatus Latescibacterota bacterium]
MKNRIIIPHNLYRKLSTTTEAEGFLVGTGIVSLSEKIWTIADINKTGDGAIGRWRVLGDPDPDYPITFILNESRGIESIKVTDSDSTSSTWLIVLGLDDYQERLKTPDFTGIDDFTVLIVGVGSVGSRIAVDLARAGVEKLILVDPDRVDVKNLCRSEYFADQIFEGKVHALRDTLHRINPTVEVETFFWDFLNIPSEIIDSLISSADLVIQGADSPFVPTTVNRLAYHKKPVVYAGLFNNAFSGFVLYTLPGLTPCYECIMPERGDTKNNTSTGPSLQWDYSDNNDRTRAVPGLGVDISRASTIASRIAISLLCRKMGNNDFPVQFDSNTVFVCNAPDEDVYSFPFETLWAKTSFREDCWCQDPEPGEGDLLDVEEILATLPEDENSHEEDVL